MTDFTSPRVVSRPALPRDKADVAEFTKFIWDGHDYVGEVFPYWLEDPQGQLLVAEYAGHCVGCAKVTLVAPGQWWLEGFRVDPKYQDKKIGSQLDAACNEWWDEHGDGVVRFLTSSKRVKVHHLSEARGYIRIGEVYGYEAEPLAESTDAFTPLKPEEVDEAVAFCQRMAPNAIDEHQAGNSSCRTASACARPRKRDLPSGGAGGRDSCPRGRMTMSVGTASRSGWRRARGKVELKCWETSAVSRPHAGWPPQAG